MHLGPDDARRLAGDALAAAVVAGTLSGAPSTIHAAVTGRPVLGAARAAGTLLGRPTLTRGLLAHAAITGLWSTVLAATLPDRRTLGAGAAAGLAIAALDLGLIGRRYPAIKALPPGPQVLDHLAFGVTAAAAVQARRAGRAGRA